MLCPGYSLGRTLLQSWNQSILNPRQIEQQTKSVLSSLFIISWNKRKSFKHDLSKFYFLIMTTRLEDHWSKKENPKLLSNHDHVLFVFIHDYLTCFKMASIWQIFKNNSPTLQRLKKWSANERVKFGSVWHPALRLLERQLLLISGWENLSCLKTTFKWLIC